MLFQGSDCLSILGLVNKLPSVQLIDFYAVSTIPGRPNSLVETTAVYRRSQLVLVAPFDVESGFVWKNFPSIQPKCKQADVYLRFELVFVVAPRNEVIDV